MRVRWLVLTATAWMLLGGAMSVSAANPMITKDATIPFGQTSVTIAWNTGDGSVGQVWFEFEQTGEKLFAQGATGSQVANFLGNSGSYTFRLYKGTFMSSPKAQGLFPITQANEFKAGPFGNGGVALVAVQANPDGSPPVPQTSGNNIGGFSSGPRGQILGTASSPPGFETNLPVSATGGYPRRVYFAWDAGTLQSGQPRPAANVNIATPPQSSQPTFRLFAQGPYGLVAFDYVVDGQYQLTLTDAADGLGLTQAFFDTRAGVVTDKPTYTGGTAATEQFGFDSDTGEAAIVCISNAAAGGVFANNGTIAALNNSGGGHASVTGLPASTTPYTLTVQHVFFGSTPNSFVASITAPGQNCGTGTPGSADFVAPKVSNGSGSAAPPVLDARGSTTLTITP